MPWQLKRKTDDGADIVDGHPLIETIRYPNSSQTWGSLMEAWDLYKSLSGNAYARFTQIGDSLKLWYLRPDRIEIIPGKRGEIESYKYTVGQHEEFYKPQEIVHFKFFDPGDDYYGLAPLQAAARIVDASNATITWNGNLVGNRARPSGMMSSKTPLTPDQHKHWREALKEQVSGEKNAGKMLINPVDATFEAFELTPLELDYLASLGTYEAAVCKVFHVHPEAIGALNATFENKAWAIRDKWEGPVQNRLNEMRATLNHAFYPLFGTADPKTAAPGELFLDYDMSGTPGANAAQGEALERATKAWACGVPWDVADEKFGVGIGPIPGGDKGYIPVNMYEVGTTVDQGRSSRTVDRGGAEWRSIEQRKQGWEKSVASKVRSVLAEECDLIVKAVKAGTIDTDPIIDAHRGAWEKLLTAVFRAVI